MVFKFIRQRSLGALAHAEYKVMTGNGTDVYMISNDLIKPDNYIMSTLTRQYVALAEYTTRDDKPAWKIWNGSNAESADRLYALLKDKRFLTELR